MRGIDIDGAERIALHRRILSEKKILQGVFREFYDLCMRQNDQHFSGDGKLVELGAGTSLFQHFYPQILSSDIAPDPTLDLVVDALDMPFAPASVRAFFGINCFHHFPDPAQFFRELLRTLTPGGGCVLIDPFYGPLARRFYSRVFDSEHFSMEQREWKSEMGIMQGANQALSYIVFFRDRARFEREFPELEIVESYPLLNYPLYFLSGGLNFRSLLPELLLPLVKGLERLLAPLAPVLGLHHVIVLRKRAR